MTHVFTLDAIARCSSRGHHLWQWVWSWGECGFDECEDCGATGPVTTRQRARIVVPDVAGAAPRAIDGADEERQQRNAQMRSQRADGRSLSDLAGQFGMSEQMVSRICAGVTRGGTLPHARRRAAEGTER